jgi:hypothetical protein
MNMLIPRYSNDEFDSLIEDLTRDLIKPFTDIVEVTYAYSSI